MLASVAGKDAVLSGWVPNPKVETPVDTLNRPPEILEAPPRKLGWAERVPSWVDVVVIGILAAVIGVVDNTGPSVWTDEAATLSAVDRSWPQLLQLVHHIDLVHFGYYAVLHAWVGVFGDSFAAMRALSAVAIGVATGALVIVGRLTFSRGFGIVAAIVFLALPVTDYMAVDARSPALSTALTVAAIACALAATRSAGRRAQLFWIAYGVLGLLATAVFVYSVLAFVALGVVLVIAKIPRPARSSGILATSILMVVAGAFLLVLRGQSKQVSWIPPLGGDTVRGVFLTQFFRDEKYFLVVVGVLLLIGIVQLVRRLAREGPLDAGGRSASGRAHAIGPVQLGLALVVIPLGALLVASIAVQPVYIPHYLGFTAPGLALLVTAVLAFALKRWIAALALAVIVVLGVLSFSEQRLPAATFGSNWRAAADSLARDSRPGDGVAFTANYGQNSRSIKIAYPYAFSGLVDPGPRISPVAEATLWGKEPAPSSIHPTTGRLWLVVEQPGPRAPSIDGYHLVSNRLVGWVGITLFEANP